MLQKACIAPRKGGGCIEVMYNPTELTLSKSVHTSGDGAQVQFYKVVNEDLTVSLFFDTFEMKADVRGYTNKIVDLTTPSTGTQAAKVPPVVDFLWADKLFTGMVTHVDQRFTMFLPTGEPVRAELTVTFKSVLTPKEDLAAQGLPNCRRLWTVSENDRLYLIAEEVYGDCTLWRLIADANNICDALGFPSRADIGRSLVIPDVHGDSYDGGAHV
jgi:hypothetical protein